MASERARTPTTWARSAKAKGSEFAPGLRKQAFREAVSPGYSITGKSGRFRELVLCIFDAYLGLMGKMDKRAYWSGDRLSFTDRYEQNGGKKWESDVAGDTGM